MEAGLIAIAASGKRIYSALPPIFSEIDKMWSPTLQRVTLEPIATTSPLMSLPSAV